MCLCPHPAESAPHQAGETRFGPGGKLSRVPAIQPHKQPLLPWLNRRPSRCQAHPPPQLCTSTHIYTRVHTSHMHCSPVPWRPSLQALQSTWLHPSISHLGGSSCWSPRAQDVRRARRVRGEHRRATLFPGLVLLAGGFWVFLQRKRFLETAFTITEACSWRGSSVCRPQAQHVKSHQGSGRSQHWGHTCLPWVLSALWSHNTAETEEPGLSRSCRLRGGRKNDSRDLARGWGAGAGAKLSFRRAARTGAWIGQEKDVKPVPVPERTEIVAPLQAPSKASSRPLCALKWPLGLPLTSPSSLP